MAQGSGALKRVADPDRLYERSVADVGLVMPREDTPRVEGSKPGGDQ